MITHCLKDVVFGFKLGPELLRCEDDDTAWVDLVKVTGLRQ